jgi:hypothetical protein
MATTSQPIRVDFDSDNDARLTLVTKSGVSLDVVVNEDGTIYVEAYTEDRTRQAVVRDALIDGYKTVAPHVTFDWADRPTR